MHLVLIPLLLTIIQVYSVLIYFTLLLLLPIIVIARGELLTIKLHFFLFGLKALHFFSVFVITHQI